ncbi:MAG TPA: phage tail protein [Puia sp.]|uniref:phage tail protein n=1 Tax=Puia sp. TaxID=2045100 RepID=UPI002C1F975F|nr:phage tail protein [Puia sp.]HVU99498.1 phage tail protein [Puia sp.]
MATNDPTKTYPLPKFHFEVDWGGTRIGFTEVSGLDFETEVIQYREGHYKLYHKTMQPGLTKYTNITLKRGTFLGDYEMYNLWLNTFLFQEADQSPAKKYRRDITIKLLDETHKAVITWTVANAWPTKVQSTDLKADANEVAIETMELAHEGLRIQI